MSTRIQAHSTLRLSLFIAIVLSACSDGGGGGASLAGFGIDDGASKGLVKSEIVSANKAATIELETGAKVEIPAGAVDKSLKVSMERPADSKALDLVNRLPKAGERIASAPYVLTPHGTKFQRDVTVSLPLAKEAREVSVAWLEDEDDKDWKVLSSAEVEGGNATVKLKHFSVLLLIEDTSGLTHLDSGSAQDDAGDVESDAGNVESDASDVEENEAGTGTPDASGPDGTDDAGAMMELDAGGDDLDAGGDLDASTGATDASVPTDAVPPGDAHQLPDGAVVVDGAVIGGNTLYARLDECSAILDAGQLTEPVAETPIRLCQYQCVLAGSCLDTQLYYCNHDDAAYGTATQACRDACGPTLFTCPNQVSGYFHCDGYPDCADGEDEVGCTPGLVRCQSGALLPSYERCNGEPACPDFDDEIGCPVHICDTEYVIPRKFVCDGIVDCVDGTDEPASCARVDCAVLTAL